MSFNIFGSSYIQESCISRKDVEDVVLYRPKRLIHQVCAEAAKISKKILSIPSVEAVQMTEWIERLPLQL